MFRKDELSKEQVAKAQEEEKQEQEKYRLTLTAAQQAELVERVCYLVDKDVADRAEYMEIRKRSRDMYEGKREPKSDPWKGCANVSTQIVNMVVEILHSRLFPMSWNDNLIYWKPMEKNDIENVENISKFMKWVIKDMGLGNIVDDFVHNLILDGTAVLKIRWVPEWKWIQRKIPVQENIIGKIKRVVMSFLGGKKEYQVNETKFKIRYEYKKFESCKVEVINLEDVGFPTYSVPTSNEEDLEWIWHKSYPSVSELEEWQAMGMYENVDKIGTFVDTLLTEGTKKSDIEAEGTKITQNKKNYRVEVIEFYDRYDYNNDGVREDIIVTVEKKSKTFMDARPLLSISRINERPFVIGQLIRRTNRIYGKSMAEVAMPLEEEINAIHNQRLDAGTMAIIPFGVYRAGSGFKPENIEMEPGMWIPVDDINDAKWITVPNNVMVSFQEERMLMELVEKLTSAGSYQAGQESDINRSRSTARGTIAIIQQGEVRFSVLGKRCQTPLSRMMNKILHQYQDKMPPGLGMRVLGPDGEALFPEGIAPEDLAGNYDNYMVLDSTAGSKQADRDMRAFVYQNMLTNPLVMQNPAGFWRLTADLLKGTGLYEDVTDIIGQRPPSPNIGANPQNENIQMLQGEEVHVNDTDNVIEHLIAHYTFRDSADFALMPPEYKFNFDTHIQETKAQIAAGIQKTLQAPEQGAAINPQMPTMQGGMNGQGPIAPNAAPAGAAPGAPGVAGMAPTEAATGAGLPGVQ